ncbi:MAG: hypothetical protein BM564_11960, partial [Bacteroidetes bacterium MedPE-SWsnd-G2]
MKKVTLSMLLLLFTIVTYGQINLNENFDEGNPADWTGSFFTSATEACSGQSTRDNLYSFSNTGDLTSPNLVGQSNETDLTINFDYKIVDWSAATNPTPAGWGNFVVQYSLDAGANWVNVATIIDDNHVVSADCASMSYIVPGADIPDGSDFQFRLSVTWSSGDYYVYYDNISIYQVADEEPACDSVFVMPTDGQTDAEISGQLEWTIASGIPTGYFLTVGTTSGGTDIADNIDVGNVTSYNVGLLDYETTYFATVTPYNTIGTTTDACTEMSFTTKIDPSITVDCTVGPESMTYCYTDNDDTAWLYTSSDGSPLRITFNSGLMQSCCDFINVYDGVDNTGTVLFSGNNGGDLSGLTFDSVGPSIFIDFDTSGFTSCDGGSTGTSEINFDVACATCVNPTVAFSVAQDCINGPQFFVEADITDLGSSASYTITDNQGSAAQIVSATGVVSFGPYANMTEVSLNVMSDDDVNCQINSASLTQEQCVFNSVDCALAPTTYNYCYGNNDDTAWLFVSTDGSPIRINFNAGGMESCCDDILIYDGEDNTGTLLYQGNNGGDLTGLTFDSTGDSMYVQLDTDGSVSCESNSFCCTTPLDFTVSCATCVNPQATYAVVQDCLNGPQFLVDVELTDLGSATSVTISDNQGSATQTVSAVGTYSFGPFANLTDVVITIDNDDDANCQISSPSLTQDQCELNVIDCTAGPQNFTYCYGNNDDTGWLFTSTDGSPIRLVFNAGGMESCCDDILVYDGVDNTGTLLYQGNNGGDLSGLTWDSIGDSLYMELDTDGSVSCESNSFCCTQELDFTVTCATCVNPQATYTMVSDCLNAPQFFVDVEITDLGSATTLTITDDQGSAPVQVSAAGITQFGPFANLVDVEFTVTNDDDSNCIITSEAITQEFCNINVVDCDAGPLSAFYCYENNDTNQFEYVSSSGEPLNLTIVSGEVEGAPWDFLVVLDSDGVTELYNGEGNDGDISGLTFQSTGDTIFFSITSDGSVSCDSGSFCCSDGIDYTVSCATCINPQASYEVVNDCENGDQFLIDVDVTSIGDATSVSVSDNQGSAPVSVTETGIVQMGPYPFLVDVVITISNDQDVNCVINSSAIQLLACPPDNDNCVDAIVATVNDDETCDILNPGTILAATPSGVSGASCAANIDDDVWFEFTALNEVQLISLVNIVGGTFNLDHALYSGDCDNLVEISCSNDTASLSPNLTVGETYYVRVWGFGDNPETTTFDLCIKEGPINTVCENATPFCGVGEALYAQNVIGIPNSADVACLGSIPNPTWNILNIGESGDIEVQIVQNTEFDNEGNAIGTGLDVDFVLWGPFTDGDDYCELDLLVDCPSCPNNTTNPDFYPFGNIVDCSYSAAPVENVSIDNAQAGETYVLLITNFNGNAGIIQVQQTNGGVDGAGTLASEIEVDLGPDQEFCGFPDYIINAESPFADVYEWYADGFIIEGETGPTLTVTETNTYTVIAYDTNCDSQASDEIVVVFGTEAVANPVDDIVTCDDASGDEIEDFDLDSQTAGILGAQDPTEFNVSYHLTLVDAQTNTAPLASPYNNISNPQTIYVRVEDANANFCFVTSSFDLIISGPTPEATSVDYGLCDDASSDGVEEFDLTSHNEFVLNGQDDTIFTVSYYASEADANAGANALPAAYTNTSNPQTVWARVESNVAFDCYSVVDFDLVVEAVPLTSFDPEFAYEVCPNATVPIEILATAENYSES